MLRLHIVSEAYQNYDIIIMTGGVGGGRGWLGTMYCTWILCDPTYNLIMSTVNINLPPLKMVNANK
jgi:hypothetical protein